MRQFGFLAALAFVLSMIADFTALPAALWILFRAASRTRWADHGASAAVTGAAGRVVEQPLEQPLIVGAQRVLVREAEAEVRSRRLGIVQRHVGFGEAQVVLAALRMRGGELPRAARDRSRNRRASAASPAR